MGLLKMDFLGLRTLSVIERCKALITASLSDEEIYRAVGRMPSKPGTSVADADGAHPLDLDRLLPTDQVVFDMFRRGDCTGVFQFESPGMRRLLTEMKPDRLEDLIAANALFRPGPMDLIPDYNKRKHGTEEVPFVHEVVSTYTAETYGVMVYQEQIMQIVHGLGGIKLRDAYTLIKNISKKKYDKIEKERPKFVDGAQRKGLSKHQAEGLFELILKFAGYGFNKSHSTGYAIVAYQTAYLKTYFPNQYMAAFLTYESAASQIADWVPYLEDCKNNRFVQPAGADRGKVVKVGVQVKPPDLNLSQAAFSVVYEQDEPHTSHHGHVRFGLSAIKGVGDKAIDAILRERDGTTKAHASVGSGGGGGVGGNAKAFESVFDLCERVPVGGGAGNLTKSTLEALVKAGAMDCLHGRGARAAMLASLEPAISAGQSAAADKAGGQGGLFGGASAAAVATGGKLGAGAILARTTAWSEMQTLAAEKAILGFYISSHPLDQHKELVRAFGNGTTRSIRDRAFAQDERVCLPALVATVRTIVLKNGKNAGRKMAVVALEDHLGQIESVAFTECYERHLDLLVADRMVFAMGSVDLKRGEPQVVIDRLVPLEQARQQLSRRVCLVFDEQKLGARGEAVMQRVAGMIKANLVAAVQKKEEPKWKRRGEPEAPAGLAVELLVQMSDQQLRLDASKFRVLASDELIGELTRVLGDGNVRFVGG